MPVNPLVTDVVTKQIAALAVTGKTGTEIAQQLDMPASTVYKRMQSEAFAKACKEIADEAMKAARETVRAKFAPLADDVVKVIKHRLSKNDLGAVQVVLKVYGLGEQNQDKGDTTINVVLPGAGEQPAIEVQSEVVNDDQSSRD